MACVGVVISPGEEFQDALDALTFFWELQHGEQLAESLGDALAVEAQL